MTPARPLPRDWPVNRYIAMLRRHLPDLSARFHLASIAVFGSFVRNEQRPDSDLDLLVTFSKTPSLFKLIELQDELSELLGVQVDLVVKSDLRPRIGRRILEEAIEL